MSRAVLHCGDARAVMASLPAESVQCVVTSPPYWGLRNYDTEPRVWGGDADCAHQWGAEIVMDRSKPGIAGSGLTNNGASQAQANRFTSSSAVCECGAWRGELGLEPTPEMYVEHLVAVFWEVDRVLRNDGIVWLNVGDSYASSWPCNRRSTIGAGSLPNGKREARPPRLGNGLKDKDLVGIPWRVAFALQYDGWWLRSDVVWSKPNPMPESVLDRPTRSHEYLFLLTKSRRYYYDAAAIRSPSKYPEGPHAPDKIKSPHGQGFTRRADKQRGHGRRHEGFNDRWDQMKREDQIAGGANAKSVWTISNTPYPEAHFATFPEELARRCILAGSKPGDTVLDPFGGSGTVAQVATGNGRDAIYIDLNPKYLELARQRIGPMLCDEPAAVA